MGKALWKLGDLYNAMWKYEEALDFDRTLRIGNDLDKVIIFIIHSYNVTVISISIAIKKSLNR